MNCIIYLVRTSDKDLEQFNESLELLEKNLLKYTDSTDVLVFVEESFEPYKTCLLYTSPSPRDRG